jgi:hypothetical protein
MIVLDISSLVEFRVSVGPDWRNIGGTGSGFPFRSLARARRPGWSSRRRASAAGVVGELPRGRGPCRPGLRFDRVHDALRAQVRAAAGRDPAPSAAAVLDAQSTKSSEGGQDRGYDAGKKTTGRKRHLIA